MSHLCASTVASWFVDVYRVAGPGLEARECLQDLPAGTDVPGFPRLPLLWGNAYMHASFAEKKTPIPSTHAQRYISKNKFRKLKECNGHVNVTVNKFQNNKCM